MGRRTNANLINGFYRTAKDWLATTGLNEDNLVKTLYRSDPLVIAAPKGIEKPAHWKLRFSLTPKEQRQGVVTVIPKGRIYGIKPNIVTPDDKLVWEFSQEKGKKPEEHSLFKLKKLPPLQETAETVAVISIKDSGIYYHWLLDVLPRLHLLKLCGIKVDKYVINGKRLAPFQYESLKTLGIHRNKILESHDELHLQARKLIIPAFTNGIRSKWACDFLKQELMINKSIKPIKGYERIYISRTYARKRKLLNESAVMEKLAKYGFKWIALENYPLAEQIRIFASAQIIAGPHGAGLTNMIFSKPGTKVIEFFAPDLVHECYPILSSLLGHQHYYLVGEGKRPPEHVDPHDRAADITVNLAGLSNLLKLANIKKSVP